MGKIRCLCSRFFVDSVSVSVHIRNNMCLKKDDFNPKILHLIYSEGLKFNLYYYYFVSFRLTTVVMITQILL